MFEKEIRWIQMKREEEQILCLKETKIYKKNRSNI